jgi:hypothetical protein
VLFKKLDSFVGIKSKEQYFKVEMGYMYKFTVKIASVIFDVLDPPY